MTFSSRVPGSLAPNRLARAVERVRAEGSEIIDLTISNPTGAGFSYPRRLLDPLADARGLEYRPSPRGLPDARQAVAGDFARRGLEVDADHIALTASTSEAYAVLFKLLCDAGDEVLVPRPSYPLFEHLTRLESVTPVPYDLDYHLRWDVDVGSVERAVSDRTRALLLVNPNNPTGSYVEARELAALAAICAARGVTIVSDEVFADYDLLPAAGHTRGTLIGRSDVLGFTLGGLSKSIGLPQAKLGWIAASGNDRMVEEALTRLDLVLDTYLSVSTPVQLAAGNLLASGATVRRQIHDRVRANLHACSRILDDYPACRLLRAEGGWSAVLQVPSLLPEEDLVLALLIEERVLVHPGYFFDFPSECYLVLSLLAAEDQFAAGVRRVLDRCNPDVNGS
ncbi:MAG: pyridoxal phosphate-dependent aminotransferase [Vicinamibacterales bacterium]